MRLLLVILLVLAPIGSASADPSAIPFHDGGPRVRPNDARVARLLRVGLDRSPTLAALVDRIESGRVIVYIEMQPVIRKSLSGCVMWVTAVGRFRYVRASINPALAFDQQIAAIGHELRHVLEIVESPQVVSEASLIALYRRIGYERPTGHLDWDTTAAEEAGSLVRRELVQTPNAAADVPASITPREWHVYYQQERLDSQSAEAGTPRPDIRGRRTDTRSRFQF